MSEPPIQIFHQDYQAPARSISSRSGTWISLDSWPSKNVKSLSLMLTSQNQLFQQEFLGDVKNEETLTIPRDLRVGLNSLRFLAFGRDPEFSPDQSFDDSQSLCFDSSPFDGDLFILGAPQLALKIQSSSSSLFSSSPQVIARLCDFNPANNVSNLIAWGPLNLSHFKSHSHPQSVSGENINITVNIPFRHVSYTLRKNHKLRLALSCSYWPLIWPSPSLDDLNIVTHDSIITIPFFDEYFLDNYKKMDPIRQVSKHVLQNAIGAMPRSSAALRNPQDAKLEILDDNTRRTWSKDWGISSILLAIFMSTGKLIYLFEGATEFYDGWVFGESTRESFYINSLNDPSSVSVECSWIVECGRPFASTDNLENLGLFRPHVYLRNSEPATEVLSSEKWRGLVRVESNVKLSSDLNDFIITGHLKIWENETLHFDKRWDEERIKRDFV